jgi:hypothetical protein
MEKAETILFSIFDFRFKIGHFSMTSMAQKKQCLSV